MFMETENGSRTWFRIAGCEHEEVFSSRPALKLSVAVSEDERMPDNSEFQEKVEIIEDIDATGGPNIWRVRVSDGMLRISGGNHGLKERMVIAGPSGGLKSFGFFSVKGKAPSIDHVILREEEQSHIDRISDDDLTLRLSESAEKLEGEWGIFDRSLNENLLRLGGDYRLGIIRENDRYRIIYLSGATTQSGIWKRGMTKGWLTPTGWDGIWNLTWIDASGQPLSKDLKAQQTEDGILELQFPYQDSKMRLRKFSM